MLPGLQIPSCSRVPLLRFVVTANTLPAGDLPRLGSSPLTKPQRKQAKKKKKATVESVETSDLIHAAL